MSNDETAVSVHVTRPFMPPLAEFIPALEKLWTSKVLTNGGAFHGQLEEALCDYLRVQHISLFSNGTTALLTALQALRVSGEVITTPYSFVATSHSLLWNGLTPVFVDIDPETLNIDVNKIEGAITPKTTAILAVHCYGRPCDVAALQRIADNYNLKIIYDAAHAFGVEDDGGSILRHGDLSVLSFHATKVFNTFEGGAIVCADAAIKRRLDNLKNFGFVDETTVVAAGINGKMAEINSAFGLLQLKYMDKIFCRRAEIDARYRTRLEGIRGIVPLDISHIKKYNYSYFPILVTPDFPVRRDELYKALRQAGIYARRYFYPLISAFSMYRGSWSAQPGNLVAANDIANRILCLPIYPDLMDRDIDYVVSSIERCFRSEIRNVSVGRGIGSAATHSQGGRAAFYPDHSYATIGP